MTSTFPHLTDVSLLRTALDCAPGGLILLETLPGVANDFRVALFNQAAEKLVGQPEATVVGKRARTVLSHLVPERLWPVAAQASASGEAYHEPLWITLPDLTRRRYDLTFCPHPNGVAVSFQDITAFEQQKALLESVVEHSPSGIVVEKALRDEAGEVADFQAVLINPKALEFGQHSREEALSQSIRQLNPQFETSGLLEAYRHVLATGRPFRVEFFHAPIQRWLELSASRIDEGQLVVLFNDMTERRQAALALERQKTVLDGVLNASQSAISLYEPVRDEEGAIVDFRISLCNALGVQLSGRPTEEVIGRKLTELYPLSKTAGLWHRYVRVHESGQPERVEHHYPDLDRWFEVTISPLGDGLVVTYTDITDRKRTDLELLRQKTLLEGVMNASLNGISVWTAIRDDAGRITDFRFDAINESALSGSPVPREHILRSKTMLEMSPESKTKGTFWQQVEVVETGKPFRAEFPSPTGDQWFDLAITKLGDGTVVTYNDITDRKRAELVLQEQAHLFNGVLDAVHCGLNVIEAVRDESGEVVDWQHVAVAKTNVDDAGLTRDDFLGKTMKTMFPGVVNTPYWTVQREVLETGVPQRFEVHYNLDGYDNYLANSIFRLDENRLISVYTLVNEQKYALRQAEEQAARLQAVLDGTKNPIVLFEAIRDERGTIVDYRYLTQNEANSRVVGLPMEDMAHRTMLDVLPGLKEAGIFDRYVAVTETGQSQRFEVPIRDGNVDGWFDLSVVKLGDGIVVSGTDQTRLRQALTNAERLVEELRRSNADLEQFAYVASHDLQEPLRKITSFGERLAKKYGEALGPDGRLYLERMRDAAARMSDLINNLLTFSRLTRRSDAHQPTDLNAVVQYALNDLEVKISETSARISVEPLPTIWAVPAQMQQLFQNLLANALKFVKPGVAPEISLQATAVTPDEHATHRLESDRRYVKLALRDNGIGFEPEYAERIFVIFQRLHGRADYEGTGIGLAICKKIVENHGGTLWAESQPGEGAAFFVVLPEK